MEEKGLIYVIASTLATRMRLIPNCEQQGCWRMSANSERELGGACETLGWRPHSPTLYSGDANRLMASHWGLASCDNRWKCSEGLLSSCQPVDCKSSADPHVFSSLWAVRDFSAVGGRLFHCAGFEGCSNNFMGRQWHPTPVLLPGKSHGQWSLVGCSPWGR